MSDKRIALKKDACVEIDGAEYIIDECINSGGQALIYRCHFKEHDNDQRYILKEYYPPEAVRKNGVITEGLEWKYYKDHSLEYYYQRAKSAEMQASEFRKNSHQAQFVAEVIPADSSMMALMRMASDDCKTIKKKLQEWYPEKIRSPKPAEDLRRVRESVKIIKGLLNALIILHSDAGGNIVHRDLTPGNILIAETKPGKENEYTVYPIDFSCCAKIGSSFEKEVSVSPGYAHPTLKQNSHLLDLYSTAALFLVLVTGKDCLHRPEDWEVNNLIVEDHCFIDIALKTLDIPFGIKSKLASVLKRASSEKPEKQYSSAKEMYAELDVLDEIIYQRGMHPEVFFDSSAKEFKEQCENEHGIFHYEVELDLVTDAVDFESKNPINPLAQNTILFGSGGAGKTTKIRELWKKCLDEWKINPKNNPIPIFVPLNTFDSSEDGKAFIKTYIATRYFPELSKDDGKRCADLMGMLRSHGRYVLFLDGINEAVGNDKLNAEIAEFAAIENVTVLITSRNDLCDGWSETKKLFSTAELLPLNDDLIISKLHDKELGTPSTRLLETLRRPMFLALYLQIKITDKAVETPGQILYAHHQHLIDAYKTGCHEEAMTRLFEWALNDILPGVASAIDRMRFTISNVIKAVQKIPIGEEHDFKLRIWGREQYLKYAPNITGQVPEEDLISAGKGSLAEKLIATMQSCGIVRATTNKQEYTFSHQNYLEFYQAYDVYLQMSAHEKGKALPQCLCENILPVPVARYLGEIWGEAPFETKVDCTEDASPIEKWMQANLARKRGTQAQLAVKNCIEIMKRTRNCYITANYSDLDLSLVTFYNCFLPNSVFTRSIINDHIFLNFGHKYSVENVAILTKKNWLITTSRQEIFFWDLDNGTFIDKVSCEGLITHMAVSDNEELIAVGLCEDGPLPVQIFRTEDRSFVTKVIFWEEAYNPEKIWCDDLSVRRLEHTSTMLCFLSDNRTLLCEIGEDGIESIDVFGDRQPRHLYDIDTYHPRELISCALSPDRSIIACASASTPSDSINEPMKDHGGVISLWGAESSEFIKIIPLGAVRLKSIAFTVDGKYIVGYDKFRRFHKLHIKEEKHTILFHSNSYKYALVDGHIATEEGLYNLERDEMRPYPPEVTIRPNNIYADAYGSRFVTVADNDVVSVFSAADIRLQRQIEVGSNRWHVWQKGPVAVACGIDSVVRLSDCGELDKLNCSVNSMQRLIHRSHGFNPNVDKVSCFHFLADEYYLRVSPNETELTVWETVPGKPLSFDGVFSNLALAKYYPKKKQLITVNKAGVISVGKYGTERQYIKTGDAVGRYPSIIIGETAIVGTPSGGLLLCSDTEYREVSNAHNTAITQIYAVANGDYFFTQAADRSIKIWNIHSLQSWTSSPVSKGCFTGVITQSKQKIPWRDTGDLKVYQFELPEAFLYWYEHVEAIFYGAVVSEDGKRIAVTDGDDIWVYNTEEGIEQLHIKGLPDGLSTIRLSPDGSILTATFHDLSVKIYNTQSGAETTWNTISSDISDCVFRCVEIEEWIRTILQLNGAIFID